MSFKIHLKKNTSTANVKGRKHGTQPNPTFQQRFTPSSSKVKKCHPDMSLKYR